LKSSTQIGDQRRIGQSGVRGTRRLASIVNAHMRTVVFALVLPVAASGCSGPDNNNPGQASAQQHDSASSCASSYSQAALAERTWAFDGVATSIGAGDDSHLGLVPVTTFRVKHWYKGGSGSVVTVQFSFGNTEDQSLRGGIGTRLLVAGEPRWGGPPLDDPVAWGCGFTQKWSEQAEREWETAFAK
jgi:hypothetical protein